ncbi:MAG: Glyoxalase/bleomycin resistance protein/dioxygenase [Candidatus Eremiobacteraeota bacterium]|nr:Glyoxalase/bleomycin resistance protein/dioxygenase [Candidatus Eremiobacteraeota bacterium]
MVIENLDHIVLEVGDVQKSIDFYAGLGLQPERLDEYRRGEVKFPSVRINADTLIDVFPPIMHDRPHDGGHNLHHFALVTDVPIAELRATLKNLAIEIEQEADDNFGARGFANSVYVRDPDGNRVEIRTYAEA